MQLEVEIYISISIWQRTGEFQGTSERTSEKFHKKGTGEDTSDLYLVFR